MHFKSSLCGYYNPLEARVKMRRGSQKNRAFNLLIECRKGLSKVFKGGETVNNLPRVPIDTGQTIPVYKKGNACLNV
ncbi:TPA: hypothetical protein ACIR1Y_002117 [Enterobacter hormaechei]|uniref:hypothetical protein n=3 Tax=Enterobacter hormaechei TaxID=158836 RepID=UPI00187F1820|nr:hypothetical protein [Enterobacter hormaechei]MBE8800829.1 hypothetical protein [Enterobacter hormaechei]